MPNIGIVPYFSGAAIYVERILVRLYYEPKLCQIVVPFIAN